MGISIPKLLIILVIVILFFGTKRLKNVGSDLGAAIKGFRNALKEGEEDHPKSETTPAEDVKTQSNHKD